MKKTTVSRNITLILLKKKREHVLNKRQLVSSINFNIFTKADSWLKFFSQ